MKTPFQNFGIIGGIRLAEGGIFVGGDELEVLGVQSRPADALAGGDGREEGIGGQGDPDAPLLQQRHDLPGGGIKAADLPGMGKVGGVELLEEGLVFSRILAEDVAEIRPEDLLVGGLAGVLHHGLGSRPDGGDEMLRLIAVGRQAFRQQAHIGMDEFILIHGEQGSVQIKKHGIDHT